MLCVNKLNAALKIMEEDNFKIVVSDIPTLPMNSLDLHGKSENYHDAIQVIMITDHTTVRYILTAMPSEAETASFKPFTPFYQLGDTVKTTCGLACHVAGCIGGNKPT
jgi:DNA-binding NtrC family response regulator